MSTHRWKHWIEIDEAATWLAARADEVLDLVRDGVLSARRLDRDGMLVHAFEVKRLAALLPPLPEKGGGPPPRHRADSCTRGGVERCSTGRGPGGGPRACSRARSDNAA